LKNIVLSNETYTWSIAEILEATGGTLVSGQKGLFRGFFIDSRTIKEECAFIAIQGKNHDGHNFAEEVIKKGCKGLIVCEDYIPNIKCSDYPEAVIVSVKDTTEALTRLAKFQRQRAEIKVIAVTGSSGKTTTRSMTAKIMSGSFETLATDGNFNNDIGLPLTLFRLSPAHKWAVLEIGASGPGEISRLSDICRPDIGIITNIGPAHLEGFGNIGGVAKAKSELIHSLKSNGIGILNTDDPFLKELAVSAGKKIVRYGTTKDTDVRGFLLETHEDRIIFDILFPGEKIRVELKTPGPFMMMNALAAAAAAWAAGIDTKKICDGLTNFEPEKGRLTVKRTKNGARLIDDTYNANPTSMLAAIDTLVSVKGNGKSFLVCGDMLELGEQSKELHEMIGRTAAEKGIDAIFIYGSYNEDVKKGALSAGMMATKIFTGEKKELARQIEKSADHDDWILVKGSRSMRMEEIVHDLYKTNEKLEESIKN